MSTDNMGGGYRDNAVVIDHTEIERAKIHEAAETKREALRLKSKDAKERREALLEWYRQGEAPPFVLGFGGLCGTLTVCAVVIMYFVHLWWGR